MRFITRSDNRQPSMTGAPQWQHGSRPRRISLSTAFAAIGDRRLRSPLNVALAVVVNLCWTVGTAAVMIAAVLGLM
jgi:hypothetical protein